MEGKYHTPPSPFQGECILISSLFSIHLVYECAYISQLRGMIRLTQSSYLLLPWRGFDKGGEKEGATPGSSFKPWNGEKKAERNSTRGQESGKGHSFFFFKKNSIIWKRVVIKFQNTLQSSTFHIAPLLAALWFFRQNLRALIKPEVLITPQCTQKQCSLQSLTKTVL